MANIAQHRDLKYLPSKSTLFTILGYLRSRSMERGRQTPSAFHCDSLSRAVPGAENEGKSGIIPRCGITVKANQGHSSLGFEAGAPPKNYDPQSAY